MLGILLNVYPNFAAQHISMTKFGWVFSKNTKPGIKAQIKHILNMKELPKDTKYLGNPLFLGKRKSESFVDLFLKMR